MTVLFAKTLVTGLVVAGFISQRPLPFLQKDKVITYSSYVKSPGDKVSEYSTIIEIDNVTASGSYLHSKGTVRFEGDADYNDYRYRQDFSSDSIAFYASSRNHIYNRVDNEYKMKIDQLDSLQYPFQMKTGDSLRSCVMKFTIAIDESKSKSVLSFTNRKVVKSDTLNLPIGRIIAWKIESDMKSVSVATAFGSSQKETNSGKLYEWFNPDYGIVKTEREIQGVFTSVELKSIK
ncbi:MAG: hypothetical protein L6Q81_10695 [Bacteroidia bacterium]|nr:hypothetical protein [Bacteroidia bacterium]